jgi:predicted dehydrogenase
LVEKPLTLDPAQAWDLAARARTGGLHLVVGYPYHFSVTVQEARRVVAGGAIGRLRLASGLFTSPRGHLYRPWRSNGVATLTEPDPATYSDPAVSGGGQGQTEVTHALANLLRVTGLEIARVSAHMRDLDFPVDVIDALTLEGTNGALATLVSIGTARNQHPLQREFRYYGDDGVVLQDLATGTVRAHIGEVNHVEVGPVPPEELYPTGSPSACLVDLMTGGRDNPAPAELGARVVACLAAAYKSAGQGGQPVAVVTAP